jgi:hypothetical protein
MTAFAKPGLVSTLVAATALGGLLPSAAQAKSKSAIERKEDALSAAGFEPKPASTPDRQQMLARLPADKFSRRVNGDTTMYVYADPKICNCLYVGDQNAYAAYRRQAQAKQIADEQQEAAQWNWGAWRPWGPHWSHFGFGPSFGW